MESPRIPRLQGAQAPGLYARNSLSGDPWVQCRHGHCRRANRQRYPPWTLRPTVGENFDLWNHREYHDFKEPKLRGYTRGTHFLVTHGFSADMAIVAEPTGSVVRLGHFGPQWVKISTYGITANTVYSGQVINPIDRMLKIIAALKAWIPSYEEKIAGRYPTWNTKPVVRMSAIQGGTPWRLARPSGICSLYLDIRTKQAPAELKRDIVQLLNRLKQDLGREDPEFDFD